MPVWFIHPRKIPTCIDGWLRFSMIVPRLILYSGVILLVQYIIFLLIKFLVSTYFRQKTFRQKLTKSSYSKIYSYRILKVIMVCFAMFSAVRLFLRPTAICIDDDDSNEITIINLISFFNHVLRPIKIVFRWCSFTFGFRYLYG